MHKRILQLLLSILVAIGIEFVYFNFDAIQSYFNADQALIFDEQDLHFQNWTETPNARISLPDPIIFADKLNVPIYKMQVEIDTQPKVTECTFFYTNNVDESFSAEKMMTVPINDGKAEIEYASTETIEAFRIDLGEEAGLKLNHIEIRINDTPWHISISRIVAMLVVYWGTLGLMGLQRSPDYGVGNSKREDETDEA